MPLQQVKYNGRKGWRWGTEGKLYFGPNAKDKALKQAHAIKATGWTENASTNGKRSKASYNPLRMDPTRTAALRRRFAAEVKRRFKLLKQDIRKLIVDEDCFGLVGAGRLSKNAFCPTGEGGGQDNSCSGMSNKAKKLSDATDKFGIANDISRRLYKSPTITEKLAKEAIAAHQQAYLAHYKVAKELIRVTAKDKSHELDIVDQIKTHEATADSHRDAVRYFKKKLRSLGGDLTTNAPKYKFQFLTTSQQQQAFLAWLKQQIQYRILGNTLEQIERSWWKQYAEAGYKQGAGRAFDDLQKKATGKAGVGDFYEGSRDQFLRSSFGSPVQVERIKILASRTFTDLQGVNEAMSASISRSLLDGLVRGDNPRDIADAIEEDVEGIGERRAEMIARTEIIRAHAEGQLDSLEAMGVEQVGVMVEWSTAGDERVCPACSELEGVVLSIQEAHNKIPVHPQCRCSFLPANVGEDEEDQVRGKGKIDAAFESAVEELGGPEKTSWQGADFEADSKRPESILNSHTENVFCPTGAGGGVDPSCSPGQSGGLPKDAAALKGLKTIKLLGGSTGAKLVEDEHGNKFVWKQGKSHGQIRAEQAAHDAYAAAGVPMVESKLYETEEGPVKIAKFVEGKTYNELDESDKAIVKAEMHKHFAVDAVLANWDVMGLNNDNVMLGKDGKVYRIDVGGSLDYRAQGGPKGSLWNDKASEMETLRTLSKNPTAKAMFGDMSAKQVYDSAELMLTKIQPILDSLPQQYKSIVASRIVNAVNYAKKEAESQYDTLTPKVDKQTIMPKVIVPTPVDYGIKTVSPNYKPDTEIPAQQPKSAGSEQHTYQSATLLHTGQALVSHLEKTKVPFVGPGYYKKLAFLNPNGIESGHVVLPTKKAHAQAKIIEHIKSALPPGITFSSKKITVEQAVGSESQYIKTSTAGAKAWTVSHANIDYSAPTLVLKPLGNASHKEWTTPPTEQEYNAISSWKSTATQIRKNIAEGKLGDTEKGILSAIKNAPKFTGIAYRGIHGEYAEQIAKSIMNGGVGSIREIPYPAGLSRNSHTSAAFSYGSLFLRVRAKGAAMIETVGGLSSEQEMLLPPGAKLRVLGFTQNKQIEHYGSSGKKSGSRTVKWFVDLEHVE